MSEVVQFQVDSSSFDAAIRDMQRRLPGVTRDKIFRREVQLIAQKLVQKEFRAQSPKVERDLRSRLVLLYDSGNEYNVPKTDVSMFRVMPKGAQRRFRAKRGGKLIKPTGVRQYKDRVGYLASGWVAGALYFGARVTGQWALRHDHGKTGSFVDGLNSSEPHVILVNKAGPERGSRQKLEATLNAQARNMQKQMEREIDILLARYYP